MPDLFICEQLGETRHAVAAAGKLIEMHLTRTGDGLLPGSRAPAHLSHKLGSRGIATLPSGEQVMLEPWPTGLSEGATVALEITRQAWNEPGRPRLAKARPARDPSPHRVTPLPRLLAAGHSLRPGWPEDVEAAWADGFEAAGLGQLPLPAGRISFTPTPAFTAVDVDGTGATLAQDAARALARAIRLWGLGGAIVVDFPECGSKAGRGAVAAVFDQAMGDAPFERTAVNGFGLMQIICPRPGPSILERATLEEAGTAAIALLASAQRQSLPGALRLIAAPAIIAWLEARPDLLEGLQRATGRRVDASADPVAGSGHVEIIPR